MINIIGFLRKKGHKKTIIDIIIILIKNNKVNLIKAMLKLFTIHSIIYIKSQKKKLRECYIL